MRTTCSLTDAPRVRVALDAASGHLQQH